MNRIGCITWESRSSVSHRRGARESRRPISRIVIGQALFPASVQGLAHPVGWPFSFAAAERAAPKSRGSDMASWFSCASTAAVAAFSIYECLAMGGPLGIVLAIAAYFAWAAYFVRVFP